jgi:hypothetical protein
VTLLLTEQTLNILFRTRHGRLVLLSCVGLPHILSLALLFCPALCMSFSVTFNIARNSAQCLIHPMLVEVYDKPNVGRWHDDVGVKFRTKRNVQRL